MSPPGTFVLADEDEEESNERTQETDNMVAVSGDQATDGKEEEQVVVKYEVVEERAQELENLTSGPGVLMVRIELDWLEDMEVQSVEEQIHGDLLGID